MEYIILAITFVLFIVIAKDLAHHKKKNPVLK